MKLPAIPHPERYAGLYVYDFGTHVSVGYTALEVRMLREAERYRDGTAYEVYRVGEDGTIELRGVLDERLTAREATCFLRVDGAAARRDYDILRGAAKRSPLACLAELQLARLYDFRPPEVTALLYPASATRVIAAWLDDSRFAGGDRVNAGIDVHSAFMQAEGVRITSCRLPALMDYGDRPVEEVLRSVQAPLQR